MDDMNITPFSSSHPQRFFEAVAWSESTMGFLQRHNILNEATSSRFPQLSIQRAPHAVVTPHPTPPPLFCKQQRYLQRNNIPNEATSSRFPQLSIQRAPHDVITPHHTPPTPPSVNNNDTCNVTTSSTKQHPQGFHNSQFNALHMTLLHPPTPHLYHNDVYSIGSRLRVPGSSGEPPALSLYIYIYIFIYIYIYLCVQLCTCIGI